MKTWSATQILIGRWWKSFFVIIPKTFKRCDLWKRAAENRICYNWTAEN